MRYTQNNLPKPGEKILIKYSDKEYKHFSSEDSETSKKYSRLHNTVSVVLDSKLCHNRDYLDILLEGEDDFLSFLYEEIFDVENIQLSIF